MTRQSACLYISVPVQVNHDQAVTSRFMRAEARGWVPGGRIIVNVHSCGLTGANKTSASMILQSALRTLTGYSCGGKATSWRAHRSAASGLLAVSCAMRRLNPGAARLRVYWYRSIAREAR